MKRSSAAPRPSAGARARCVPPDASYSSCDGSPPRMATRTRTACPGRGRRGSTRGADRAAPPDAAAAPRRRRGSWAARRSRRRPAAGARADGVDARRRRRGSRAPRLRPAARPAARVTRKRARRRRGERQARRAVAIGGDGAARARRRQLDARAGDRQADVVVDPRLGARSCRRRRAAADAASRAAAAPAPRWRPRRAAAPCRGRRRAAAPARLRRGRRRAREVPSTRPPARPRCSVAPGTGEPSASRRRTSTVTAASSPAGSGSLGGTSSSVRGGPGRSATVVVAPPARSVTAPGPSAAGAVSVHVVEPSPRGRGGESVPADTVNGGGARRSGLPRASTAKATTSACAAPSAGNVGGTAPSSSARKRRQRQIDVAPRRVAQLVDGDADGVAARRHDDGHAEAPVGADRRRRKVASVDGDRHAWRRARPRRSTVTRAAMREGAAAKAPSAIDSAATIAACG